MMGRGVKVGGPLLILMIASTAAAAAGIAAFYLLKASYVTITVTAAEPGAYTITGTVQCGEVKAGSDFSRYGQGRLSLVGVTVRINNTNESVYAEDLLPDELEALWNTKVRIEISNKTDTYYGYLTIVRDGKLVNEFDGWYHRHWWRPVKGDELPIIIYPPPGGRKVGPIDLSKGNYDVRLRVEGTAGFPSNNTNADFYVMINATTVQEK